MGLTGIFRGRKMPGMTLGVTLMDVWRPALVEGKTRVELEGEVYLLTSTRAKKQRTRRLRHPHRPIDVAKANL